MSLKKSFKKLKKSYQDRLVQSIMTASGLFLALVYKDALQNIINTFIKLENTVQGNLIYIGVVTAIIVTGTVIINKWVKT